ncbi:unnamed protein product [Microthlaspi erraticum]|uniref:Uncharacterized protein n=1 Tax=Microthlaspi erraticum TaxID=1685480 RepID=A0A6D2L2H4_9BRAS|nr:unnamed protein product [Microthlaspi erraticum]
MELDEMRVAVGQAVDHFTDVTVPRIETYIEQENDIHKLQRAFHVIESINAAITNPSNFGEVNQQATNLLNNRRNFTVEWLTAFRDETIPSLRNYINKETSLQNLQQVVRHLEDINNRLNSADVLGVRY